MLTCQVGRFSCACLHEHFLCFDLNDFYVGSKGWLEASGATFAPALARPHYHPGVPVYGKLASVVLALPQSVAGSSSIRPLGAVSPPLSVCMGFALSGPVHWEVAPSALPASGYAPSNLSWRMGSRPAARAHAAGEPALVKALQASHAHMSGWQGFVCMSA